MYGLLLCWALLKFSWHVKLQFDDIHSLTVATSLRADSSIVVTGPKWWEVSLSQPGSSLWPTLKLMTYTGGELLLTTSLLSWAYWMGKDCSLIILHYWCQTHCSDCKISIRQPTHQFTVFLFQKRDTELPIGLILWLLHFRAQSTKFPAVKLFPPNMKLWNLFGHCKHDLEDW